MVTVSGSPATEMWQTTKTNANTPGQPEGPKIKTGHHDIRPISSQANSNTIFYKQRLNIWWIGVTKIGVSQLIEKKAMKAKHIIWLWLKKNGIADVGWSWNIGRNIWDKISAQLNYSPDLIWKLFI